MATILNGQTYSGRWSIAVMNKLYVKGDDDGLWYEFYLALDSGTGVYIWSAGGASSEYPTGAVNISDHIIGSAFLIQDALDYWHQFNMTETDPAGFGYVWKDTDQFTTTPTVSSRRLNVRADDGLYITDLGGAQIHKMGVTGGLWTELSQGYTIPL